MIYEQSFCGFVPEDLKHHSTFYELVANFLTKDIYHFFFSFWYVEHGVSFQEKGNTVWSGEYKVEL